MHSEIDESVGVSFINRLLLKLNGKVSYCLARGQSALTPVKSDTDIIINKKEYTKFLAIISYLQVELDYDIRRIIKRQYVYTHMLYLKQHQLFIQLDVEFDFDWWSLKIVKAEEILNRKIYNNSLLAFSSIKDSSFMKFYRSLIWGSTLSEKYANDEVKFDNDFLKLLTYIKLPPNISVHDLKNYYSFDVNNRVKLLRKELFLTNIKTIGLLKTIYNFIKFLLFEFNLLFTNNGVVLFLNGDDTKITNIRDGLMKYVKTHNAPFKKVDYYAEKSFLVKRKLLRDSFLLLTKEKHNSDYQLSVEDDHVILNNNSRTIYRSKYTDFLIKDVINLLYK